MTYFTVDPEQQKADAEERVRIALRLLDAALDVHAKNPSRVNEIALQAATRLVKETTAELEEWTR